MNLTAAIPVHESSQVAVARRAATRLAEQVGFCETRAGQTALVASELATNLAKHARAGEMLLRPLADGSDGPPAGLELLALDAGPGIPDIALSSTDGISTTGTLGHGLGAIQRLADVVHLYSTASGTVVLAQLLLVPSPPSARLPPVEIGAVRVSMPGEDVCGDDWAWRVREGRAAILVADGLGHGLYAYEAARQAVDVFRRAHEQSPASVLQDVHLALRATRGAAVAALALDLTRGVVQFAGLGNIAALLLRQTGRRQAFVSHNGTAGHAAPRLHEFQYPVDSDSVIVMHSDGLASHWDLAGYPGLLMRHPGLIAATLYRDVSRRRDDVTVVVVKRREPAATSL